MSTTRTRLRDRLSAVVAAGALAAGVLAASAAPAQAAPVTTTGSGPTRVTDATFTWGYSGYAHKGILSPWAFKDATGNASILTKDAQTEYQVDYVPTTSQPSSASHYPTAAKFTAGTGTVDVATGASSLTWDGEFTLNAYPTLPAGTAAPDETYADPQLTVATNGSGTLSFDVTIGAAFDQSGNPTPATSLGRKVVSTFDAGDRSNSSSTGYRISPDFQGVAVTVPDGTAQVQSCSDTGRWGSWPAAFVTALPSSIRPHYYSTGCGGMQDNKPALPFDVAFHAADAPTVTVDETTIDADGQATVTVTGHGFDPALATGTRPPLSGQPSGVYVAVGKFATAWRPSTGAASSTRKTMTSAQGGLKWAVLAANQATIGGSGAGAIVLSPEGGFTTTLTVDKALLDAIATDPSLVNYGIYTYPGGGGTAAAYETYTPITFAKPEPTVAVTGVSSSSPYGAARTATVTISGTEGGEVPAGTVTARVGTSTVGTAQVDGTGVAKVTLARTIAVGPTSVVYRYSGDDRYEPASTTKALKVVPAKVDSRRSATTKPTTKKAGRMTVTVTSLTGGPAVNGRVQVSFKKPGKTTKKKTKTLSSGKGVINVPALAKGKWKVYVKYLGSTRFARTATTYEGSFTVVK
jgi:hypothetical protein